MAASRQSQAKATERQSRCLIMRRCLHGPGPGPLQEARPSISPLRPVRASAACRRRVEQRVLLGRDEAVDRAFDAMVVDRLARWRGGLRDQPLGDFEGNNHAPVLRAFACRHPLWAMAFAIPERCASGKGVQCLSGILKASVIHRRLWIVALARTRLGQWPRSRSPDSRGNCRGHCPK